MQYLLKVKDCVCGNIVEELPFSQSTISQHLKALKDAGIIKGEIGGVRTCYYINENLNMIQELLGRFFNKCKGC